MSGHDKKGDALSPFDKAAADRMAAIIDDMIYAGHLDSRSDLADARLDYGQPFTDKAERAAKSDASATHAHTVGAIMAEVERARAKHPGWPANDTLFAAAIVAEESGELMRAAVQHKGEGGSLEACDKEAIQTAAVAIRFLERR